MAERGGQEAFLTVRVGLSALHELKNDSLTPEENLKIFGKCFRTHGHDYYLEVTFKGPIDPVSGLCCDRDKVYEVLEKQIVEKFHGQHLNRHFKNTSGEELAREFYGIIKRHVKGLYSLRLQETPKNFFYFTDYPA